LCLYILFRQNIFRKMYMNAFILIVCILFISLLETFGQGLIKSAHDHRHAPVVVYIGLALAVYAIIVLVLYYTFGYQSMAIVNAWWNIMTSITVTLSGLLIFHEHLAGTEMIGVIMVLLGSFFLSYNNLFTRTS
jgi:drug/metabolite transporter (DMT)-like permease